MRTFIKIVSYILIGLICGVTGFVISRRLDIANSTPQIVNQVIPRPLEKYTLENLMKTSVPKGAIQIGENLSEETNGFTSNKFSLEFDPTLTGKQNSTTTGVINMPIKSSLSPLIIMFRGYVDPSLYSPGVGTAHAAEEFAKAGFITVAPDFLGYGGSSDNAEDIFESRFQTYTTALAVMNAIDSLPQWDHKNVFIWGHSNGGQIALTTLEITGYDYPTVLWAPVSKSFPYSVLYYTEDSADNGKFLIKSTADFEDLYDAEKYSLTNYLDHIKAPIQLNQGTSDDAVPLSWSNQLYQSLKKDDKMDITYYSYPGADHNLTPGWDLAVERGIEFFRKYLK